MTAWKQPASSQSPAAPALFAAPHSPAPAPPTDVEPPAHHPAGAPLLLLLRPRPDFGVLAAFVGAVQELPAVSGIELTEEGEGLFCRIEVTDQQAVWLDLLRLPGLRLHEWCEVAGGAWSAALTAGAVPAEEAPALPRAADAVTAAQTDQPAADAALPADTAATGSTNTRSAAPPQPDLAGVSAPPMSVERAETEAPTTDDASIAHGTVPRAVAVSASPEPPSRDVTPELRPDGGSRALGGLPDHTARLPVQNAAPPHAAEAISVGDDARRAARQGPSLSVLVREGQVRMRAFEDLLYGVRTSPSPRMLASWHNLTVARRRMQWRTPGSRSRRPRLLRAVWVAASLVGIVVVGVALWAESRSPGARPVATRAPNPDTSQMGVPVPATVEPPARTPDTRNRALPVTPPAVTAVAVEQPTATAEPGTPSPSSTAPVTPEPATPAPPTPPPTPAPLRHRVQPGETVFTIAQLYGVSMAAIIAANGLPASAAISAGQELIIPRGP